MVLSARQCCNNLGLYDNEKTYITITFDTHNLVDHDKATPFGDYVSGPPPACIFENMRKCMVNARIRFLKRTDFRIISWATTNMLNLTAYMT